MTVQVRRTHTHTHTHHLCDIRPSPRVVASTYLLCLVCEGVTSAPLLPVSSSYTASLAHTRTPLALLTVLADDDIFIRASDMARGN